MRTLIILFLISFLSGGCDKLKTVFTDISPYEEYLESLEKADLRHRPMVEEWKRAGEDVFKDSILIQIPFSEQGFFSAGEPEARSYRIELKEGQVLEIAGTFITKNEGKLFLDLFKLEDNVWKQIAHSDTLFLLPIEFDENTTCLLRIQPELLVDLYYTLNINLLPALINPVSQASDLSIGSFYGDPRDAGKRIHEGVDIFASRGTPVIAPANGFITRVGTNKLGGKVIWMRDRKRGHSYYFAHLDSQLISSGVRVNRGDTIGLVGNTGNARTTAPHLHFAIYEYVSRNPLHYLRKEEQVMDLEIDTTIRREDYKVIAKAVNMRAGPTTSVDVIKTLKKNTFLKVIAKSDNWYRVLLPDRQQGYIIRNLINPIEDDQRKITLKTSTFLLTYPEKEAVPKKLLEQDTRIKLLAQHENFQFIETEEGLNGWVENTTF